MPERVLPALRGELGYITRRSVGVEMEEYLEAMSDDMKQVLDGLARELTKVRTGRASPKLVEGVNVTVASYGASMRLNELATVKAPDARLLVITPWDKSTVPDIQRAILAAGLGLNPATDGQVIRVPVPALTAERRRDLEKAVRRNGENAKVRARSVRKEYNDTFKAGEKDGDISEDEMHRLLAKVQDQTNAVGARIEAAVEAKLAEVREV